MLGGCLISRNNHRITPNPLNETIDNQLFAKAAFKGFRCTMTFETAYISTNQHYHHKFFNFNLIKNCIY